MGNDNSTIKPPMGVMTRKLYIELRILDLTKAMHEYSLYDISEIEIAWSDELYDLLQEHKMILKEETEGRERFVNGEIIKEKIW